MMAHKAFVPLISLLCNHFSFGHASSDSTAVIRPDNLRRTVFFEHPDWRRYTEKVSDIRTSRVKARVSNKNNGSGSCPSDQFQCKNFADNVCSYQCDGFWECDFASDELLSDCPDCAADPSKFTCKAWGMDVCLSKAEYQCNSV